MDAAGERASSAPAQEARAPTTRDPARGLGREHPGSAPCPRFVRRLRHDSWSPLLDERISYPLDSPRPHCSDFERNVEVSVLRVRKQPGLGATPQTLAFAEIDRLERVAEAWAFLQLHLAEHKPPAAPDDQVELDAAGADVARQNPVAATAEVPGNSPFCRPPARRSAKPRPARLPHRLRCRSRGRADMRGATVKPRLQEHQGRERPHSRASPLAPHSSAPRTSGGGSRTAPALARPPSARA